MNDTPLTPGTRPLVVVGVDGSDSSVTALRYAAAEARLRGAALHAVGVYIYGDSLEQAEQASRLLNAAVDTAREAGDPWPDEVTLTVREGAVPDVLHRASTDAVLLVVGADAHGLLGRLIQGSVLPKMTHHVHVPTVIVPTHWHPGGPR